MVSLEESLEKKLEADSYDMTTFLGKVLEEKGNFMLGFMTDQSCEILESYIQESEQQSVLGSIWRTIPNSSVERSQQSITLNAWNGAVEALKGQHFLHASF